MTLKVENRLKGLKTAVEKINDENQKKRILAVEAGETGRKVLGLLRAAAPKGKAEPGFGGPLTGRRIKHERPSIRLGHGTLESNWGTPAVRTTTEGAKFFIRSSAAHMQILLDGAKEHPIPLSGIKYLSFWWFRGSAGVETFRGIDKHPGFAKAAFVKQARGPMGGDRIIQEGVGRGAREMISPLRVFMQ